MKKLLLSLACLSMIYTHAQIIQNGDFEASASPLLPGVATDSPGWGQGLYTIETTGSYAGAQSVKLTTIVNSTVASVIGAPSDTLPGLIQQIIPGPIANASALTLNYAYKNTTVSGDSALVLVQIIDTLTADQTDDVIMYVAAQVYTSNSNMWSMQSIPLMALDTAGYTANLVVFIASSSVGPVFGSGNGFPNSELWLDNISLSAPSSGISELTNTISVYPNPVKNILNMKADGEVSEIVIVTMDGKVVKTVFASSVDVSDLNPGMYMYRVNVNGKVLIGNFIKE